MLTQTKKNVMITYPKKLKLPGRNPKLYFTFLRNTKYKKKIESQVTPQKYRWEHC